MTLINSYVEQLFESANRKHFLTTLIVFIVIGFLIAIFHQFSMDAYFITLSSIFQGLFSILALAGIFVVFRIEQLSKDQDKYETDFKDYLIKIKNHETWDLSTIRSMYPIKKYSMDWNEHDAILNLLDERKHLEYSEALINLNNRLEKENREFEEELNELKLEIEENEKKGEPPYLFGMSHLNKEDVDEYRKQENNSLKRCENYIKECKKKGDKINYHRSLKNKILNFFRYPFILGMILIALAIFLLPMLNSNSGSLIEFPFHIPSNLIVGLLVSLTIMVIFTIMLVILYSMFGNEAKKTMI